MTVSRDALHNRTKESDMGTTTDRPFAVCFDCGATITAETEEALNGAIYLHQQECDGEVL